MKVTFNQHIGIFENAISNEWCDKVINFYKKNNKFQKSRLKTEGTPSLMKADHSLDPGKVDDNTIKYFYNLLSNKILPKYNDKYNFKYYDDFKYTINDFKTQKTLPSEGYHLWHYENSTPDTTNRLLVYSVYLNDVNEGGETEFLYQSLRVKPKKGTIVIWPAGFTHYHRGNPPLSGEKYITTGWVNIEINNNEILKK